MRKWQCVHFIIIYWEWGCWLTFFGDFQLAASKMAETSHFVQISSQFTSTTCHWIVYEEVLALDTTIFDGLHCEYDRLWCSTFWVEMLRWKMTISRKVEWPRRRLNMLRDHSNMVEEDTSVWFEQWELFLLISLDLFVRRTIRTKCNNRHFSATKAPMTKPEHVPSLARHSR